jgi:perosamine synthetase
MKIFNSLGSNYDFNYVLRSLFSDGHDQGRKLINLLEHKYSGKIILTYKGREALILALKTLNLPEGSCVAINGFTCYAVYKAINEAGLTPICLDLENKNSDLNFSAEILQKTLEQNINIKAVVIQNTLGSPCDVEKIAKICAEKNIILIEDLAHCVGTKYNNGKEAGSPREAGTVGDLVALSFSQDKVIDSVSGGALVIRNKKYIKKEKIQFEKPKNQTKDKLYSLLTYKIRFFYNFGLGKLLHFIFKSLNLLSKPMTGGLYEIYSLPNWYCNLALFEFRKLNEQLNHRKEIARIYAKYLNKKILNSNIVKHISNSTNLRFSIFVENRGDLIKFLKKGGIFASDIWYSSVAPECPNAVEISKRILNLPTHINITKKSALKISERINVWLKSQ